MIDFGFAPDPARAAKLNTRMHSELADSLDYAVSQAGPVLQLETSAIAPLLASLRRGESHAAVVFADYYEFVEALMGRREAEARVMFDRLCGARPLKSALSVVSLGDASLGETSERYRRMMNGDPTLDLGFTTPTPELAAAFEERLERGWRLLDTVLPELSAEVRAIVREVVIAGSDPTKKYQFDGGSHFKLWGALFLNCQYHMNDIAVCEVLAHESAHSLLFGFCTHEALVENDDEDLYSSPLRADPRPMDGIYHATFVSARMHWAMSRLAESPQLTDEQRGQALAAAESDLVNFNAGYGVVAEHGVLTATGAALMGAAHAYMQSVQ